jgi:hypothetical protein
MGRRCFPPAVLAGLAVVLGITACGGNTTTVTQTPTAAATTSTAAPAHTVTQVVKTKTVIQNAPEKHKAKPKPPPPAPASTSTAAPASSGPTVPGDIVGKKLNDVEDELDSKGISYSTVGGNVFLRGDWGVCSTTPSAGSQISGAVLLHIGHFTCGAD